MFLNLDKDKTPSPINSPRYTDHNPPLARFPNCPIWGWLRDPISKVGRRNGCDCPSTNFGWVCKGVIPSPPPPLMEGTSREKQWNNQSGWSPPSSPPSLSARSDHDQQLQRGRSWYCLVMSMQCCLVPIIFCLHSTIGTAFFFYRQRTYYKGRLCFRRHVSVCPSHDSSGQTGRRDHPPSLLGRKIR